ncbi:amino acid adenylation domain-containing protein, partial [Streptomyces phyllanthi]|nr:amino acid adenylation domain-containing protein [Streptomyces phyllanthi]
EAALAAHPDVRSAVVAVAGGTGRLVAYAVPADHDGGLPPAGELRDHLRRRLPEFMVPVSFTELAALPLTPNGKVDRAALPDPDVVRPTAEFVAPRNEVERVLAEAFARALGVDRVGIDENFFELGGDSIIGIQVVARARSLGVGVSVAQLFDFQTVGSLAGVAEAGVGAVGDQGVVAGDVVLSPVQRWFFGLGSPTPWHFNQSVLLEAAGRVDAEVLRDAMAALLAHHDGLRSRFELVDGEWRGRVADIASDVADVVWETGPCPSGTNEEEWLTEVADRAQESLDLSAGPLVRAVLFDRGERSLVLVVAHHLVVDTVSWPVLVGDLGSAYGRLSAGEPVELPAKTTSFAAWTSYLAELAGSDAITAEAPYWERVADRIRPVPRDRSGGNAVVAGREVRAALDGESTSLLLSRVPSVSRLRVDEVLLAGLGMVLGGWLGDGGSAVVDVESHGRHEEGPGIDLSRTVGWFTCLYPVVLPGGTEPGRVLADTKEMVRRVPRHGLGYGLLRHLTGWRPPATAEISFNYLGQAAPGRPSGDRTERAAGDDVPPLRPIGRLGREQSDQGDSPYLIGISGQVVDGRLILGWNYSGEVHDEATISALAHRYVEVLGDLIDHCCRPEGGGYTPSDFPLARLDQSSLDHIKDRIGPAIEDIYPLTGLQQGMLFHSRLAPGMGMYWVRMGLPLQGDLDLKVLRQAWELVFARHEVLRTGVVWEQVPVPMAVVSRSVPLPWQVIDLSGLDEDAQRRAIDDYLAADETTGADFAAPTLVRVALVRLGERRHHLLWSYHHLVLDGWSAPVVLGEVLQAYGESMAGRQPVLPDRRPFRDFVAWLAEQGQDEAERYWREQLAGFTAPTSLGIEHTTGQTGPTGRDLAWAPLPADLSARVAEFARRHRLTVNTVVQGAWAVLTARYAGTDDVVFGVSSSGRSGQLDGIEAMVGLLMNTTPARIKIDLGQTVPQWLAGMQVAQARGRRFEHTPLTDIQACSEIPAGQSLFEVVFVFENYPLPGGGGGGGDQDGPEADDLRFGEISHGHQRLNYPLVVIAGTSPDLQVGFSYDLSRFAPATIDRLAGHLAAVLAGVVADDEGTVGDLSVLSAAERAEMLEWGSGAAGPAPVPGAGGVHDLVAEQVRRSPDAVAVVCGSRRMTYGGLWERAGRLAGSLRAAGAGPESVVGLCLERGIDMVAAVLATWRAGAAFVPLDPEYPSERLALMLADSGARVVVGHRSVAAGLVDSAVDSVVWLDDPTARIDPDAPEPMAVDPAQLAYVIYTSGSTGVPKGVQVGHGGLVNLAAGLWPLLGEQPRGLLMAPFSFDAAVWELVMVLSGGGTLVVASSEERAEPGRVAQLVRSAGVELAFMVPSLLRVLAPADLAGLKTLVTGAERVEAGLASAWRAAGHRLLNAYGPTEATVVASIGPVDGNGEAPPIGKPVPDARLYVVDGSLNLVPTGVAGELLVGGAGVARGYAGRAGLTAERFVADPFAADGSRAYRTGDRVRWRADGRLEFVGRVDDQVKVRGYRIEPAEIETVLAAHPDIRSAVVTVTGDGAQARLAAYLVPADPAENIPAQGELRDHLRSRLPVFMIPASFTELAALPLTPGGKIDRAALPDPDPGRSERDGFVAPSTPAEEVLAGIWAELLQVDRIGACDDFFQLGGHSLLATQVMSRVRAVFGAEVPLSALFEHPTVRGLAEMIEGTARGLVIPPVTAVSRDRPLPLSFAQQRLWFLQQLEPESTEYNLLLPMELGRNLDVAVLGAALGALVARHEVLRTRLVAGPDGVAYQVIDPPGPVPLPVADVSGAADPAAAARDLLAADASTPFDLATGPLVRACLIRLGEAGHVLVVSLHHVVFDEWSARVFRHELSALYTALRAGEPDPLPPLSVQYADFAAWQRSWLAGEVLDGQLAYWRDELAEVPALELPTDRPRPPVLSTTGAAVEFTVPADTADRLRDIARDNGATMFMTLLAGFDLLLSRYCGTDDIVVGTPVAGRNRAETEDLIGFFVNTLVMRTDVSGDPSFTDLVGRVRETALGAYAHQDLPFEQLVDALVTDRDRSRTLLFQVFFNYVGAGGDGSEGGDAQPEPGAPDERAADMLARPLTLADLDLTLSDSGEGGLAGVVQYSTALFDATTIERLAGHLSTLLAAAAADAARPLSALPVLTADERTRLLHTWNDTAVTWPASSEVPELIASHAVATPDAIAVDSGGRSLSYGALLARAAQLAHHLRAAGVGPESVVGLGLSRGIDLTISVLAIWQAGGAFLPLDPDHPAERLAFMLDDSGATVLVGGREMTAALPDGAAAGRTAVLLDDPDVQRRLAAMPTAPPVPVTAAGRLAYVIYTSGSTGTPKGVMIAHDALANYVRGFNDRYSLTARDRVLMYSSPSTDAFGIELYPGLAAGGTLVIVPASGPATDIAGLAETMADRQVTLLGTVPAVLRLLSGLPALARCTALRQVVCGGEQLTGDIAAALHQRLRVPLHNVYGPTEATIDATSATHDPATGQADGALPIGGPIANTRAYVLDRHLNPVPVGVVGELFLSGVQLARGYGSRPALTAERFVADPSAADGSRMYRTGDRVRWHADGRLEFLSRTDEQVKVRGYRIEPGEVEAVLAAHPGIQAAAVVVAGDGPAARLAAFLVPADTADGVPAPGALRGFAGQRLPDFMVPSVFIELAALPLTPAGKVDRAALPVPDTARPELDGAFVTPATPAEELLAGIWAELLEVDRVGADDDFFELGGHSLLATQVVSRVREVFGAEVPLVALFDHPTVRGLAEVVEGTARGLAAPPMTPVPRDRPLPLSFAQQRLWFLDQLQPGSVEYVVPFLEHLGRDVDVAALTAALSAVVTRHEVLRTRLVTDSEGTAWQVIDPPGSFDLPVADVSSLADPVPVTRALLTAEMTSPFDLAAGPLVRACLVRLGGAGHVLALTMHHVVSDEWSDRVLRRDLLALYEAFRTGEPDPLPPLGVQYADFAAWQRSWLTGEVLDGQLAYWRERLADAPVLELPTDRPRPPVRSNAGAAVGFTIPEPVADGLREIARRNGATMFMALLAGFSVVLGRYADTEDVVVGSPVAGRNRAETEDLIGFFVNMLVMRTHLSGGPSFTEVLGRVRETALGAYAHQDLPFEQLVDALVTDRDRSRTPLFQVSFDYFGDEGPQGDTPAESGEQAEGLAKVDLRLTVGGTGVGTGTGTGPGGGLTGMIAYATALFDRSTVERMAEHLCTVLAEVTADAARPLSAVPMLTADERAELVEGWSGAGQAESVG